MDFRIILGSQIRVKIGPQKVKNLLLSLFKYLFLYIFWTFLFWQVLQRELERLEEERISLKTENRSLAKKLGGKSADLGLTVQDLQAVQDYTEALRQRRLGNKSDQSTFKSQFCFLTLRAGFSERSLNFDLG